MLTRKILWTLLVTVSILSLALMGCSSKKFTNTTTTTNLDTADPTTYIPLDQGWRVSYTVLEPATEHYDIEVSDPAVIAGHDGYTIRRTNRTTLEQTYKFMYATSSAIYESSASNDPGSKILAAPFVIGNSWDITEATVGGYGDTTGTDFDDGDDIHLIGGGDGEYNQMSIVAKESVEALDGHTYSNCLKVEWQTGEYSYNYYWYAAGIGLVKYESVPNSLSAEDNNTVTVMSDYAQITY